MDEDDFIFYGTPIEREEETSARKRKAVADAGQLRSLPAWKQDVRDEEGRRRFHGAFTGGFSAGFYNTVGSKEGWTPQTFTSSRKNRAEVKQQTIYHFLDDDDIKDMGGHALETSMQFDTFGFTAAEYARKQAQKEQEKRPSAIPGPAPDDIVLPASESIGMKLLQKMGWRRGHSIRETHAESLYYARREARKALLAFSGNVGEPDVDQLEASRSASEDLSERCNYDLNNAPSTPAYVFNQKKDLHGLGYDPFKHAPEFRDRKRLYESRTEVQNRSKSLMRKDLLTSNSGKYAPGFGIGALEELDIEDEDIYASSFELEETEVEDVEPARMIKDNTKLVNRKQGVLPGFKVASNPEYSLERFHPPLIPSDFKPVHKFRSPPEPANKLPEAPPQEVPPPEDNNLKLLIDGFATLVARCGKLFEDISKEKHKSNPLFAFLTGGNGYGYYERKLWEEKQRHVDQLRLMDMKSVSSAPKLTAESRGRILGERPLEKSTESSSFVATKEVIHLQSNLSDTFTKPSSLVRRSESAKPFNNDPAKQERFEQFLKDKYQGGLRSTLSGGGDKMSEVDRARERLDFEAAAETMEKGELHVKDNLQSALDLARSGDMQFIPSGGTEKTQISEHEEKIVSKICPKREEFQWRPSPILCKRFDITDPFMGKPAPLPRPRSRMDTLIFTTDSAVNVQPQQADSHKTRTMPPQPKIPEKVEIRAEVTDDEPTPTSVQRPVDLYKAIFSDDSDGEGDNIIANANKGDDPEKKTEGANKTLNRLIAGDFLESLGKELGLEVPSDSNGALHRTNTPSLMDIDGGGEHKVPSKNEVSTFQKSHRVSGNKELIMSTSKIPEIATMSVSSSIPREVIEEIGSSHADSRRLRSNSSQGRAEEIFFDHEEDKAPSEKRKHHRTDRHKTHSRHHRRSSDSDSDVFSDHGHYDRSESRADKRSSEGRNHSKHHKSKRRRSRSRSRYYSSDDDSDLDCKHERSKERKQKDAASDALRSKRYGPRKHH